MDDERAEIGLVLDGEEPLKIILDGVVNIFARDFGRQNVVDWISVHHGTRPEPADLEGLLAEPHSGAAASIHAAFAANVENLLDEVAAGRLVLVQLAPAAGCEMAVLCRNIGLETS